MDPFDVGRVKENLPTTHIEFGSESERRTFELENATGENSAYEGSGQKLARVIVLVDSNTH
ncbi:MULTISPECIES: hypothetical protein [Vibrio]|uniref:hypothetical protein n=1 Tax=Vibrio TaxID=662 RepID=UPI00037EBAA9|nr:hypothetical protein [Vibrio crassostreae]OEE87167.1 hypothetical protein A140_08425 [Vibrio crassostreae 9ZC88]